MTRRKTRTAADIVFDLTVHEMQSDRTEFIKFDDGPLPGSQRISGTDWSVIIHTDLTTIKQGNVPAHIVSQL